MTYHQQSRRQDLNERRISVKDKARYNEVAAALGLDTDLGDECPWCFGLSLKPCCDGKGCFCEACSRTGDMIDLVEEKRGGGHVAAIEFLESLIVSRRDSRTGDLFGGTERAATTKNGGKR